MLLSCSAKKVTKECGQRGAEAGRSRAQSRPLWNPPARTSHPLEHLNGQNLLSAIVLPIAAAPLSPLCRQMATSPFGQKIGTFFVRTGCRLRCSSAIASARRERYIGEGVFACGSKQLSASPMSPSFGTFLGEARKVHAPHSEKVSLFRKLRNPKYVSGGQRPSDMVYCRV